MEEEIRSQLKKTIYTLDDWLARVCLPITDQRGLFLSFLIHGIFKSEEEARSGLLDPQQSITVDMLRRLIEYFTRIGYKFISTEDLVEGPSQSGKHVLLTFDDGYYNNLSALPVLEDFGVPAVFFISSGHVELSKAFWWDVVHREFKKRGRTDEEIRLAGARYKQFRTSEVESDIRQEFGESALQPVSDLDRPFTASELRKFANHRLVFLGNHTKDHAILTNYSGTEISEQIRDGQDDIRRLTGKTPQIIAYPNGNYSSEVLEAAKEAGLQFGLLAQAGRNRLPMESGAVEAMTLKRFTLWGDRAVEEQCRASQSGISLYRLLKKNGKEMSHQPSMRLSGKEKVLADPAGS